MPEDAIEALARDREHGASEITQRALEAMPRIADTADEPLVALADAGACLVRAHPAMAPLVHLADQVLARFEAEGIDAFDAIEAQRSRRARALAQAGAKRIGTGDQVATYSRSGTVLAALRAALEDGPRFTVLVSEARPGGEGLSVARALASDGIPVTVTTDAALTSLVREADQLLVGADAICQAGLVNKIGTHALAREAARADVPVAVLAGTDKLLPPSYRRRPPLTTRASIGHELPDGVHEADPLFECEPMDPIDAVVTEQGVWTPGEAQAALAERALHPLLLERLG